MSKNMTADNAFWLAQFALVLASGTPHEVRGFLARLYKDNPMATQVELVSVINSLKQNIDAAEKWAAKFSPNDGGGHYIEQRHQPSEAAITSLYGEGVRAATLLQLYKKAGFPMNGGKPKAKPAHIEAIAEFLEQKKLVSTEGDTTHIRKMRRRAVAHFLDSQLRRKVDKILSNGTPNKTYSKACEALESAWDKDMRKFWFDHMAFDSK